MDGTWGAGASGSAARGTGLGPGRGAPGFAPPGFAGLLAARSAAARPLDAGASAFSEGNDSRSRRATGASTVDDADFTNSPCSLSRARSSLLVTPSSLANSCTRALPATALLTERPSEASLPARPRVISDGRSSLVLHGVLISAVACSCRRVLLLSCPRPAVGRARRAQPRLRTIPHFPIYGTRDRKLGDAPHCAGIRGRSATTHHDRSSNP